ncbi:MAG: carboxylesterase/lipase family protein [Bacteroidales bacterium]|nr:carboxylesterase/lipase family protein [Bacteroidales bacterium]
MRRYIYLLAAALSAATLLISCASNNSGANADSDGQILFYGDDIAVAQTTYGKVRGFILRDIYTFKGIPYGASTAGENRFMPPVPPEPWEGVRNALNYGDSAPQVIGYQRSPEAAGFFTDAWNYDVISEDCLRLNVWTPGLDNTKRPVIVWLHGGGFSSGNAIEQDGYGGENLARYGDVVFCSVNHRLNCFGYSDFASVGGEKYKHSGNVGMLDIVAALQWIHDNIAQFGGDPGNVTVIGQSGGGSKVSIIASMPAAKGLVHKGVALSGNSIQGADKASAEALGEYILKEAGLKPSEIDKLQQMPWEEYYALANRASRALQRDKGIRAGFSPVSDGIDLPFHFFDASDPSLPDIPMLYCTVFNEQNPDRERPELEDITLDGVVEQLSSRYGDQTRAIVEAYNKTFPGRRPIEIWALLTGVRTNVVRSANTKLQQKSPVYMAWFGWQPPLFDGRMRSFHCLDICFWLHNTDVMLTHTGGGKRPRALSDKMSDALVAFMRTGDPNTKSLPYWPKYTAENGEVMVLDDVSEVKNDPDRECRALIENLSR